MGTKYAIERATLRLNVLTEQQQILEQLDGYSDCWCKYRQWTLENKIGLIQSASKSLGFEGFGNELAQLLSLNPRRSYLGEYPECLKWKNLYKACLIVKVIPDALVRIRNSEDKMKEASAIKKEAEIEGL